MSYGHVFKLFQQHTCFQKVLYLTKLKIHDQNLVELTHLGHIMVSNNGKINYKLAILGISFLMNKNFHNSCYRTYHNMIIRIALKRIYYLLVSLYSSVLRVPLLTEDNETFLRNGEV